VLVVTFQLCRTKHAWRAEIREEKQVGSVKVPRTQNIYGNALICVPASAIHHHTHSRINHSVKRAMAPGSRATKKTVFNYHLYTEPITPLKCQETPSLVLQMLRKPFGGPTGEGGAYSAPQRPLADVEGVWLLMKSKLFICHEGIQLTLRKLLFSIWELRETPIRQQNLAF